MVVLIGTLVLGLMASFLFGSLIHEPVKALSGAVFDEVTARRLARTVELLLYGCLGVIVFRYLARFFPLSCAVGKTEYGWLRASSGIVAAVVAIMFASIGTFSHPGIRLVPTLVFVVTLGALVCSGLAAEAFSHPAGTLLFLRRFASFADRSVVSSVLRAAPRGGNVTFLVAAQEPASNWDPWSLGFAGFRLLNPLSSIPTYYVSSDEAWEENVSLLIRKARCVVMDVSDFSPAIAVESRLVIENSMLPRTVFLAHSRVDKSVLRAKIQQAGLDAQAIFDRLYFYHTSWPRTLLRVLLMTAVPALMAVVIWVLVAPRSVILSVLEAVLLGAGVLFFCRDIAWRRSIGRRSKREIRSRIRQALAESAHEYRASSAATDVFEAIFGAACGAFVMGFVFFALGYSDFTLSFPPFAPPSTTRHYPERAADWSQLGAFLGVAIGVVCSLLYSRAMPRRYRWPRTVAATFLGTAILPTILTFMFTVVYVLLSIQGQQERLLAAWEHDSGRGMFWLLPVLFLAIGVGCGREFGQVDEPQR